MSGAGGWIGVDLDGTLAYWDATSSVLAVGAPIPAMVARVKGWLAEGREVRIVTARVGPVEPDPAVYRALGFPHGAAFQQAQIQLIDGWCRLHLGQALPVTATKDFHMAELWDDRCVQVQTNTGRTFAELYAVGAVGI